MSNTELVAVSKGTEYLEVHPSTLISHIALGWRACERHSSSDGAANPAAAMADLLVARDMLACRKSELDECAERLDKQQRANEAEADRLAGEAAKLVSDKADFEASKAVAVPATGKGKAAAAPAA